MVLVNSGMMLPKRGRMLLRRIRNVAKEGEGIGEKGMRNVAIA